VGYGDFAENLTTEGVDLVHLPVGTSIRIGNAVTLRVTQIGRNVISAVLFITRQGMRYAQGGDLCRSPD